MARQPRLHFIGRICLQDHRIIYQQADKINADNIAGFFCRLRKNYPEKYKIHLILDNADYHKSPALQKFTKNLAPELHYLPPYSSNLNPIERL